MEILVGLFGHWLWGSIVMGKHSQSEEDMQYEIFSKVAVALFSSGVTFVISSLIWAYFGSCN